MWLKNGRNSLDNLKKAILFAVTETLRKDGTLSSICRIQRRQILHVSRQKFRNTVSGKGKAITGLDFITENQI